MESLSVSKIEISFLNIQTPIQDRPTDSEKGSETQLGSADLFRVESSDGLNAVFGVVTWPNASPEVRIIEFLSGTPSQEDLKSKGRMSVVLSKDGKWLVELRAMQFDKAKGYFILKNFDLTSLDDLIEGNFGGLASSLGALRMGTREDIDQETNKRKSYLAMVVEPGDLKPLAFAFAVTRALTIIKQVGQN
jgi:hypothetical protein